MARQASSVDIDMDDAIWSLKDLIVAEEDAGSPGAIRDSSHSGAAMHCDLQCPFCGSDALIDVTLIEGNLICRKCSSIVSRFIDGSPEWRYYGADDSRGNDPARCGPPVNPLLPSYGCVVGGSSSSMGHAPACGGGDAASSSYAHRMIQRYQFWNSMTYRERSLHGIFSQLSLNAVSHGLASCIIEEAKVMYKKMSEMRVSRGENREALIASSVYMACKRNKVPRSVREVADMYGVKLVAMTKACKLFQSTMQLNVQSSEPDDFVARFCCKLNLDTGLIRLCKEVLLRIEDLGIACESTPPTVVAGVIQLCNHELHLGIERNTLAEACKISPVTVGKCFKRLAAHRAQLLFDDEISQFSKVV